MLTIEHTLSKDRSVKGFNHTSELWQLPHTVQQKHYTAQSTADTLNYRVTYNTKKLRILPGAIEVLAPLSKCTTS